MQEPDKPANLAANVPIVFDYCPRVVGVAILIFCVLGLIGGRANAEPPAADAAA